MAGVGGDQVIDPVELAMREPARRRDRKSTRTPPAVPDVIEPPASLPACAMCQCQMPVDARFCPSCGERADGSGSSPGAAPPNPRPRPYDQLTPDEKRERDYQHARAVAAGKQDPAIRYVAPQAQQRAVLIHVLEDGFTAFGQVWYHGQELEVAIGGPRWEEAQRWILWDDFQQMAVYGKINFRRGPWPGLRSYTAAAGRFQQLRALGADDQYIAGPSPEALAQADALEQRRNRGIPAPSFA